MNIGEIARRAGVSRSTVSYALSGKRTVSEATRRRIQDVITELDFRPNASARALAEGRTRTLGLVVPPASRRLTAVQLDFVASVVDAAAVHDLDVLLSPSGGDHDRSFERLLGGRRVDGVVLMEVRLGDQRVERLSKSGLPFVTIGRVQHPESTWWVDVDFEALVSRCVHHLADLGHERVVLINRSPELVTSGYGPAMRASAGFSAAVGARGVEGTEVACADDAQAGEACVEEILRIPGVTAAVTVNEAALTGVQRGLQRAGLRMPQDFSLVGVVAQHLAEDLQPPLTAADVPAVEMGRQAVELLQERIAVPDAAPKHRLFAPPISLRASTAPRPRA